MHLTTFTVTSLLAIKVKITVIFKRERPDITAARFQDQRSMFVSVCLREIRVWSTQSIVSAEAFPMGWRWRNLVTGTRRKPSYTEHTYISPIYKKILSKWID